MLSTHFACRVKPIIPAARGAAADVPVWASVHSLFVSVVDYCSKNYNNN